MMCIGTWKNILNKGELMRNSKLVGILLLLIGVAYLYTFYLNGEIEIKLWGIISIILGSGFILLKNKYFKIINIISIMIQLPVVYFYVVYNQKTITDSINISINANIIMAMPHIFLVILNINNLLLFNKKNI